MAGIVEGQVIRGYELVKELGRGGFGAVYRAHQALLKRDVAIKVILPKYANKPDFIKSFEVEAELIARLEHPFIVPLYDYWRDPKGAYLVMRLVSGGSLRDVIEERPLTLEEIANVLDQIGTALYVSHRDNVIHRDIKPDNILVDKDFNAYLSDFGIAKETGIEDDSEDDSVSGSLHYIPPEQIQGAPVTPQTDIYALGWVLYEMLAGEHPYEGATASVIIMRHITEPTPDIGEKHPEYKDFNAIIQRATAKDPEERYESTVEMARAFREALSLSTGAVSHSTQTGGWDFSNDDLDTFNFEEIEIPNPYKGLQAFQESDSGKFYGRSALVEQLLSRLTEATELQRFLAVIGPSGSGKSSVVKAGVIPALREGRLPGSENWLITETIPSINPFTQLETSLLRVAVNDVPNVREELKKEHGLHRMIETMLPPDSQLVLVVDQFEELFTLVDDEKLRNRYLDNLIHAFSNENSRIRLIITLRADYYDKPLHYRSFGEVLRRRTEVVLPLSREELAETIERPAGDLMVMYEPGLVETIIADVGEQPSTLPLLQYALTELFEKRMGYSLGLDMYHDVGGVTGALARRADELYTDLDADGQEAVRQLFLRLVNVGEGGENTRRRVRRSELPDAPMMEVVIEMYGSSRLLTFDRDPFTREGTIEVAHEAIIRRWERLAEWIEESRESLQIQSRLTTATQEWQQADQDPAYLASGVRLVQFESLDETDAVLTAFETDFLKQSIDNRDEKRRLEDARKEHELQLQKQATSRLRYLAGVMVVFLIVAIALSLLAYQGQVEAEANEALAVAAQATSERQSVLSGSRALAGRLDEIAENDPFIAYALAEELLETVVDPPPSMVSDAIGTILTVGIVRRIEVEGEQPPRVVAFSADGNTIISGSSDGRLAAWDTESGELIRDYNSDDVEIVAIDLVPNTNEFITINDHRLLQRWELDNVEPIEIAFPDQQQIRALDFTHDGQFAIMGDGGGTIIVIDYESNNVARSFQTNEGTILEIAISPTDTIGATAGTDNVMAIFNYETGDVLHQITAHTDLVFDVEFTSDGQHVISSSTDGQVLVWDVITGEQFSIISDSRDAIFDSTVTSDGLHVLSVGQDENLIVERLSPVFPRVLSGHRDAIFSVDISPDDTRAVTASTDGTLVIWSLDKSERIDQFPLNISTSRGIQHMPDGERLLVNINDNAVLMWDWQSNQILQRYEAEDETSILSTILIPGRDEFIAGTGDGRVLRFDIASGEIISVYDGHDQRVWSGIPLADGKRFLSASLDTTAKLWDIDRGEILQEYAGLHTDEAISAQPSPDMRFVATSSADTTIGIWNLESGELITQLTDHTRPVIRVAFSTDSSLMLSHSLDGSILLWDTSTWEVIRSLDGHNRAVMRVHFLDDPTFAVSVSWDETAILWDVETGTILRRFEGAGSPMRNAALSPNNEYIAASTWNGPIIIWWIRPNVEQVLSWANENLFISEIDCNDRATYQTVYDDNC